MSNSELHSISTDSMTPEQVINWFEEKFRNATEFCGEAESYFRRMKEHHDNLSKLMGRMSYLKSEPQNDETKEEESEIIEVVNEIMAAMTALRSNNLADV